MWRPVMEDPRGQSRTVRLPRSLPMGRLGMCRLIRDYMARCGWLWLSDCGRWQPLRLPIGLPGHKANRRNAAVRAFRVVMIGACGGLRRCRRSRVRPGSGTGGRTILVPGPGVEPGSLGAPGVTGVIARWKHCSWRAASSVGSSDPAHLAGRGMWSRRALRQAGSLDRDKAQLTIEGHPQCRRS